MVTIYISMCYKGGVCIFYTQAVYFFYTRLCIFYTIICTFAFVHDLYKSNAGFIHNIKRKMKVTWGRK